MPNISLTDFVDFTSRSGIPRISKVSEILRRGDYDPRFDFWKRLREEIQERHRTGTPLSTLPDIVGTLADRNKRLAYPGAIDGYVSFVGRKRFVWSEPPRAVWSHGELQVRVNPEIGLIRGDDELVVKLYFKSDPLAKQRIDVVLWLLEGTLRDQLPANACVAVLDVQRGRLHRRTREIAHMGALLAGEAQAFISMWSEIEARRTPVR